MSGNQYIIRRKQENILSNNNAPQIRAIQDPVYEGIIVDVVLDHKHPLYAPDGYNVGAAKVRILSIDNTVQDEQLSWAVPFDSTIEQLPLIGEYVVLHKLRSEFFYTRKVPIAHRVQENAFIGYNQYIQFGGLVTSVDPNRINPIRKKNTEKHKFGKYFKPDSRVRPLKHFEGDTIVQGRMGHSIRLGSSKIDPASTKLAPNIILRTGQALDAEKNACTTDTVFGLIVEDINKDATSIWMTSDQAVEYIPSVKGIGSYSRSVKKPPQTFEGAQILAVSDRIVLNSRKNELLLYSNSGIHLNSFLDSTVDTDKSIILTANLDITQNAGRNIEFLADEDVKISAVSDIFLASVEKTSIVGKKIHIGSVQRDAEPLVGGTSLSIFLARLILALMGTGIPPIQNKYQTQGLPRPTTILPRVATAGPATIAHTFLNGIPCVLNPLIVSGLTQLYAELAATNSGQAAPQITFSGAPFNSADNFVTLSNEKVPLEKNEFSEGKPIDTKISTWDLSKPYYRVE